MRSAKELRNYQFKIITQVIKKKQLCIFSDPGTGKTVSILFAMKKLKPQRTLILAPKLVCETVWMQEAQNWVGLKHMTFTLLCVPPNKRAKNMFADTHFHLINYELIAKLVTELAEHKIKLQDHYDAIVFDEASNLKNVSSKRFWRLRKPIKEIPIRVGATGTPIGNNLLNLWGEMYMCADVERLGRTFTEYKQKYFIPESNGFGYVWKPKERADELVKRAIAPHSVTVTNYEGIPQMFAPIRYVLPAKVQCQYDELQDNLFTSIKDKGGDLLSVSGGPAVVKNKLRQLESGAIYKDPQIDDNGNPVGSREWINLHQVKFDELAILIDSLEGQQLLLAYHFNHELERLNAMGIKGIHEKGALTAWLKNKFQVLALHPASAGHGLNLHTSGCYHLCFLSLPWSYELFKQTIGRLTRIGQTNTVIIHYFSGPQVENEVFWALKRHGAVEDKFMDRKLIATIAN